VIEVGGQKLEIFPESETQFFFKEDDVLLVFVKDEQGRVVRLLIAALMATSSRK